MSADASSVARPLAQRGIVVTRPEGQAAALARALAELGANPIVIPTIAIEPPADMAALDAALAHLASHDFAVFVSVNAVEQLLSRVRSWPASVRALAPGPGTAAALAAGGVADTLVPTTTYDSEGLLALPELRSVAGKRFVIFRGDGGRELLGETLVARGATVDYVSVYRRAKPAGGGEVLIAAWLEGRMDAITVTSSEGLENLWDLLDGPGRKALRATPLFAPHPRIAQRAHSLGVAEVVTTAAGDAGLIAGLVEYFRCRPRK